MNRNKTKVLIYSCFDNCFLFFPGHKKSVSQEALSNNGFSNNFGHPVGGAGYRGVEGVLMSNSMKTFVTRCVECARELYSSDNIVSQSYCLNSSNNQIKWIFDDN